MAGYEINFAKMKAAIEHLETSLRAIDKEMKSIESVRTTTLSDAVWKGPNKSSFSTDMAKYENALNALYKSANEHYIKLNEIVKAYANQEAH